MSLNDMYPTECRTCRNCKNWDIDHQATITKRELGGTRQYKVCPCAVDAVGADAGRGSIVLLGADSDCLSQSVAWEPADDFRVEWAEYACNPAALCGLHFQTA